MTKTSLLVCVLLAGCKDPTNSSLVTPWLLKLQFLTVSRVSTRFSDQTSKTVDFCRNNAEFDTISSLVIKPNP